MSEFFAWVMSLLALVPGLGPAQMPGWNGYVEEDYVYASAPTPGTISSIAVKEGQSVAAGQVLFVLDQTQQESQFNAAKSRADAAQATLLNLQTGSRQDEIDVIQASLKKAQSDAELAKVNLARSQDLFDRDLEPQSKLDADKATSASAQSAVDQLQAQLKVAQLPARDAQQVAAEASLKAAQADAQTAQAALDDRAVKAPEAGRIERLFFKAGEVAAAGVPVLSMSGADALKIKFYVNEADRGKFALGQRINVSCDGCASGLTANIDFFASDPEFTPPIIYSRDERSRLVFLTEAVMDNQSGILPGQPVTIGLTQ